MYTHARFHLLICFVFLFGASNAQGQSAPTYTFAWDKNGPCWSTPISPSVVSDPDPCPAGYLQTSLGATTANCGAGVCPCTNWMDCAHRSHFPWGCPNA